MTAFLGGTQNITTHAAPTDEDLFQRIEKETLYKFSGMN